MRYKYLFLIISFYVCANTMVHADTECAMSVEGLRCEYRVNPEGIDVMSPRLSWLVVSSQRCQKQTAYQIIISSSSNDLDANKGDLWDTGKVVSDNTLHIEYSGISLSSYQRCWWKVRVWDKNGQVSAWSNAGYWSMGILSADQWQGQWLGYVQPYAGKDLNEKGSWRQYSPSPVFRKEFSVKKQVKRASLYICGLGYHEVYLNGAKVGDHTLDPAFTRYDYRCLYVTHDITNQLINGNNAIGVMLGNGWFNVFSDAAWDFNEAPWRGKPQMLAQILLEYSDGTYEIIASDNTWKAATGPVFMDGIRQGEYYDARREMPGWDRAGFDDSGWHKPLIKPAPAGKLCAQMVAPVRVTKSIKPKILTEPEDGVYVFDLGQNISGRAQLKVSGRAGTKVQLRYSEVLDSIGRADQTAIKKHNYDDVFQTDTYILKGDGVEIWEPRFVYHGFRYIEVTGLPECPSLDTVIGRFVHTDFAKTGQFSCSNEIINKMQSCILWAYCSNFVGYPTDCPQREKNGWTGDAHLAAEQAMYNWANGSGYTKWLLDMKDAQLDSGEFPGIVPSGGWGYNDGEHGPGWDSAYFIIPWYLYCYYGDIRILETHYEGFKRYLEYAGQKTKDNIASFGLGDWVPAKTHTSNNVTSTAFYYMDTVITAKAAKLLGYNSDAEKYNMKAEEIMNSYNDYFYKGQGIYANGSQTALSFPVYSGLVPADRIQSVIDALISNIQSQENHVDTGILGAKAIYNVLSENGCHDLAYKMVLNPTKPSYADWINQGCTTFWESWDGKASRNHIMFGDIGAWFYKNVAGICLDQVSSDSVAFKHFVLRPRLTGDLTWANADYSSIRGKIISNWEVKATEFKWNIRIPANTTATVYVPSSDADTVLESGITAGSAEGVSFVYCGAGYSVYSVESGNYNFVSNVSLKK